MSQILALLQQHSEWPAVDEIYRKLRSVGYKAYLAGGCVRDALLGKVANDLDIATDASPEQIEVLFEKTVAVGKSFGVIRVLIAGSDIEVATFRTDGVYADGRRPEQVVFSSPQEDALRRDFTINALFFDLSTNQVIDFVQGQEDLQKKIIRAVGDPEQRFREDHLRILRAVRFTAQLGFVIEAQTLVHLSQMASLVKSVSGERLKEEWIKLLRSPHVEAGLSVAVSSGLMKVLFPFRAQDSRWNPAQDGLQISEDWQALGYFLMKSPEEEFKNTLSMLKLSTKEKKNIEDFWGAINSSEKFFSSRFGEQLQRLARPGVFAALSILAHTDHQAPVEVLLVTWKKLNETLPKPFLTGSDLNGKLDGPALGKCLQEGYNLQLEGTLENREQALTWVTELINKGQWNG